MSFILWFLSVVLLASLYDGRSYSITSWYNLVISFGIMSAVKIPDATPTTSKNMGGLSFWCTQIFTTTGYRQQITPSNSRNIMKFLLSQWSNKLCFMILYLKLPFHTSYCIDSTSLFLLTVTHCLQQNNVHCRLSRHSFNGVHVAVCSHIYIFLKRCCREYVDLIVFKA